jgi:hypothetical protein
MGRIATTIRLDPENRKWYSDTSKAPDVVNFLIREHRKKSGLASSEKQQELDSLKCERDKAEQDAQTAHRKQRALSREIEELENYLREEDAAKAKAFLLAKPEKKVEAMEVIPNANG